MTSIPDDYPLRPRGPLKGAIPGHPEYDNLRWWSSAVKAHPQIGDVLKDDTGRDLFRFVGPTDDPEDGTDYEWRPIPAVPAEPKPEHAPGCHAVHYPGTPCFDTPVRTAFVHQPGCNTDHTPEQRCIKVNKFFGRDGIEDLGMAVDREAQIRNNHAYHAPNDANTIHAHQIVRAQTTDLAIFFERLLPESHEKEYALKAIREAMMWGNAAIAIHGVKQS